MQCPHCGKIFDKVVDSRLTEEGIAIRRRRECLSCGDRFTTYESTEDQILPILMRKNVPYKTRINNIKASITFLSRALKGLREGAEALIEDVDRVEKAEAEKRIKRKTVARASLKRRASLRKSSARKAKKLTDTATVIKRHKRDADISNLRGKKEFDDKKIKTIVYKLKKQGKIKRGERVFMEKHDSNPT